MRNSKPEIRITLSFLCSLVFLSCSSPKLGMYRAEQGQPSIRVALAGKQQQVFIDSRGSTSFVSGTRRFTISHQARFRFSISQGGAIRLNTEDQLLGEFDEPIACFSSDTKNVFEFDGKDYSDTIFVASDGKSLYVVNVLPVEEYLKGVVANEMGRNRKKDELEALKAQAIVARTYALMKTSLPILRLFDVYDDTRDQVYSGVTNRSAIISQAVDDTRGVVLAFGDQFAETYFHSTCGGSTEAPQLVWNRPQGKSYLNGVRDADEKRAYCQISPSYRWTESYSRTQLEAIIKKNLAIANKDYKEESFPPNWNLLDLRITKRMPSGRVSVLIIIMGNQSAQKVYEVRADQVRSLLRCPDGNVLRSNLFDISLRRDENRWLTSIRIDGGGNGHGVGMCQWGAIGMARQGMNARVIVEKYFPGTETVRVY